MSFRFQAGLVAHFLADYALLYLVIARAQAAGGAKGAVWTFLATSLPALALFALAPLWDRMQRLPLRSVGVVQALSRAVGLMLCATHSLLGLVGVALVLGAIAKAVADLARRAHFVERSITPRYACMIPGAAWILAASLAAIALSFGLLRLDLSFRTLVLPEQEGALPQIPSWRFLSEAFGRRELAIFALAMVAVSAFMAIEYPLLTDSFGFARWLLPVVWGGHLAGSLLASLTHVSRVEERVSSSAETGPLFPYAVTTVAAFGAFAVAPPWIVVAALLMALATLLLCRFEIVVGKRLLDRVGETRFARANVQMRGFELGAQIAGPALMSVGVAVLSVRAALAMTTATALLAVILLGIPRAGTRS